MPLVVLGWLRLAGRDSAELDLSRVPISAAYAAVARTTAATAVATGTAAAARAAAVATGAAATADCAHRWPLGGELRGRVKRGGIGERDLGL